MRAFSIDGSLSELSEEEKRIRAKDLFKADSVSKEVESLKDEDSRFSSLVASRVGRIVLPRKGKRKSKRRFSSGSISRIKRSKKVRKELTFNPDPIF
jgi:hypothetical protein